MFEDGKLVGILTSSDMTSASACALLILDKVKDAALRPKEIKLESKVRCSDCGKILLIEDQGLKWDRCQVCSSVICFNCTYYNREMLQERVTEKSYFVITRVCQKHRI